MRLLYPSSHGRTRDRTRNPSTDPSTPSRVEVTATAYTLRPPCCPGAPILLARDATEPLALDHLDCGLRYDRRAARQPGRPAVGLLARADTTRPAAAAAPPPARQGLAVSVQDEDGRSWVAVVRDPGGVLVAVGPVTQQRADMIARAGLRVRRSGASRAGAAAQPRRRRARGCASNSAAGARREP